MRDFASKMKQILQFIRVHCSTLVTASLFTIQVVKSFFGSNRTAPIHDPRKNSFSWIQRALLLSLSTARSQAFIKGGKDFLERKKKDKNHFSIYKSSIIGQYDIIAQVYSNSTDHPIQEFNIEGSYIQRNCTILYNPTKTDQSEEAKVVVAEIKRKMEPDTNVVMGKDVFLLCLKAGIDGAFIMALVLVLDQVEGHDFKEGSDKVNFTYDH